MSRYDQVNAVWPAAMPPVTPEEAISAAKRLWRKGTGKAFAGPVRCTSGRRYTRVLRGTLFVNPAGNPPTHPGWIGIVHSISHAVHRRLYGGGAHTFGHHQVEQDLAQYVIDSGWLSGTLKREAKPKPDPTTQRYALVMQAIERWERKRRRASTALAKLAKQRRYYERKLGVSP